jgi:hypothetical protein
MAKCFKQMNSKMKVRPGHPVTGYSLSKKSREEVESHKPNAFRQLSHTGRHTHFAALPPLLFFDV